MSEELMILTLRYKEEKIKFCDYYTIDEVTLSKSAGQWTTKGDRGDGFFEIKQIKTTK